MPKVDEKRDPSEGLMDMLKQMYEDGDDEMKRTIAKSWCESRNKQSGMDLWRLPADLPFHLCLFTAIFFLNLFNVVKLLKLFPEYCKK